MNTWKKALIVKTLSVAVVIFAIGGSHAQSQNPSLMRLRLGMTPSEINSERNKEAAVLTGGVFQFSLSPAEEAAGVCKRYRKIGGIDVEAYYHFIDGRLEAIQGRFKSGEYDAILATLKEKYGPGMSNREVFQNAIGAKFERIHTEWTFAQSRMYIRNFETSLDQGTMGLLSEKYLAVTKKKEEDRAESLKNGL